MSCLRILALGVQRNFWNAYERGKESALTGSWSRLVEDTTAISDQVKFANFESAPIPGYWGRGRPIQTKSF